jgi:hypothetical protein
MRATRRAHAQDYAYTQAGSRTGTIRHASSRFGAQHLHRSLPFTSLLSPQQFLLPLTQLDIVDEK